MIIQLHGIGGSLDYRAGDPLAELEIPDDCEVDPERDRAKLPGDPAGDPPGWQSGVGLILHARAGMFGCRVLRDGYLRAADGRGIRRAPAAPPEPVGIHRVPRDAVSCLRCRQLCLASRPTADPSSVRLSCPSWWIRRSLRRAGLALPEGSDYWPKRAGVPHQCAAPLF